MRGNRQNKTKNERSYELFNYFNLWINVLGPNDMVLSKLNKWLGSFGVIPFSP